MLSKGLFKVVSLKTAETFSVLGVFCKVTKREFCYELCYTFNVDCPSNCIKIHIGDVVWVFSSGEHEVYAKCGEEKLNFYQISKTSPEILKPSTSINRKDVIFSLNTTSLQDVLILDLEEIGVPVVVEKTNGGRYKVLIISLSPKFYKHFHLNGRKCERFCLSPDKGIFVIMDGTEMIFYRSGSVC